MKISITIITASLLLFVFKKIGCQSRGIGNEVKHEYKIYDKDFDGPNEFRDDLQKNFLSFNETDLTFTYYISKNNSMEIKYGNEEEVFKYWRWGASLKVITHGWRGNIHSMVFDIKTAYLETNETYNVITLDWHRLSNHNYPIAAYSIAKIGKILANLLRTLVNHCDESKNQVIEWAHIHLIGHSLGAHICGVCGKTLGSEKKIGRITGLDPAGPLFEFMPWKTNHLNSSNAHFVDVIHSSSMRFGYSKPIGHADFYLNNGKSPQPGCSKKYKSNRWDVIKCSHFRPIFFYVESVLEKNSLIATKCESWKRYTSNECKTNEVSPVGNDANLNAKGKFYLVAVKNV